MEKEIFRQIVHILLGLFYAFAAAVLPKEYAIALFAVFLATGIGISLLHKKAKIPFIKGFISHAQRENEKDFPGKAAIEFTLAALVCAIVFYPFAKPVLVGALLALSFGDALSTIIGKKFGKTKTFANRTLEGTVACFVGAFAALLPLFGVPGAAAGAIAAAAAEYVPFNDNFTIPIFVGLALVFFI